MAGKTEENIISRLKIELKNRKLSVPKFEEITGIPKDRVYKWLKRETGKVDYADAKTIEDWLIGNLDNVPRETKSSGISIEKAIENLTVSHKDDSNSLKRLITILEVKYGIKKDEIEVGDAGDGGTKAYKKEKSVK